MIDKEIENRVLKILFDQWCICKIMHKSMSNYIESLPELDMSLWFKERSYLSSIGAITFEEFKAYVDRMDNLKAFW